MTPILKKGSVIMWGRATREAKVRTTNSGKIVAGFSMMYDRHHNEDGRMVNEYMEVSLWGDNAKFIGDEDVGIAKGDTVLVCGQLVEDTFRKDGEDPNIQKWKINADIVLDMTSIFQVAQMVVNGEPMGEYAAHPHQERTFTETTEKTPFAEELENADGELPY